MFSQSVSLTEGKSLMSKRLLVRVMLSLLLVGMVGGVSFLQLDNLALAKAIANKPVIKPEPPKEDPVVPDLTPEQIKTIKAKLLADGCNFNADTGVTRKALGNCKILLIGDSLGNNLAYGMMPQLANQTTLTFTRTAKASTGLSNPWFYNWHTALAAQLKTYKPNLVIVFIGANDRQNYVINGVTQTFGTEAWKKTYRANISKLANAAINSGAYVLWIGMPIMKPYNYAKGETLIDEQFALTVPKLPGALYLPTRAYTADAAGNYRQYALVNGSSAMIRGEDGIHFTAMGQSVLATFVINNIIRTYHVQMTPQNPRYITK